jgi:hypothetical protein
MVVVGNNGSFDTSLTDTSILAIIRHFISMKFTGFIINPACLSTTKIRQRIFAVPCRPQIKMNDIEKEQSIYLQLQKTRKERKNAENTIYKIRTVPPNLGL